MIDFTRRILTSQFDAALCMLHDCIETCPPQCWEEKVASLTVKQVAYHTLFFVDAYLSRGEDAFELRELHRRGGDELGPDPSPGLDQQETLSYLQLCREKMLASVAAETQQSLEALCGFSWRKDMSRGELHIYNIRHIQHHTGQLSAALRRLEKRLQDPKTLRWVGSGWRAAHPA